MKNKKMLLILLMIAVSFFTVLKVKENKIKAAGPQIELIPSTQEYTNQLSVQVKVNHSVSNSLPSYACFLPGNVGIDAFSSCTKNSTNSIQLVKDNTVYVGTFLVNMGGTYTVFVQNQFKEEKSIKTIEINNIDSTADTIVLTQRKVTDKLKNIIIDIEISDSESEVVEVKYAASKRDVADLREYGTPLEDWSQLIVSSSGIYTVYVKDAAGNENVSVITVSNSTLVNGDEKIVISPANQLTYKVKNNNGTYYIELPKADSNIKYSSGKVIVLSLYNDKTNSYESLEKTQGYKTYVILDSGMVSDLKKDRYIITIDPSIISTNYVENETYVVANYITKKEARRLGYKVSLIDKNVLLIGAGVAAILGFIFILGRIRIKRSSIDD